MSSLMKPQSLPLTVDNKRPPDNTNTNSSLRERLLSPIRFCGREWVWMKSIKKENKINMISQIFKRVFALPFLTAATIIATGVAIAGALIKPKVFSYSKNIHHPSNISDIENFTNKNLSDVEISDIIIKRMNKNYDGLVNTVNVKSGGVSLDASYYPDKISRTITLTLPSIRKTLIFRISNIWPTIKDNFYNKKSSLPDLKNIYSCLNKTQSDEVFKNLEKISEFYDTISIYLAFDFCYIGIKSY